MKNKSTAAYAASRRGADPRVRIVIPACKTDATLGRCLEALCAGGVAAGHEIVVVDDGGNGSIERHAAAFPIDVILGAQVGSAAIARNLGASGDADILVFIDADVVVEPGAVERLIQPIIDGDADATVGNYSDDVEGMTFAQRYKQLYISRIYRRQAGAILNQFWTALGAIRNDVFHEMGGFRPVAVGAAGEDIELGQRLSQRAKRIHAVPTARGKHLKPYTFASIVKNDFRKGVVDFQLALTHRTQVTDHRHARPIDVAAVALAYLVVLTGTIGWLAFPAVSGWALVGGIALYSLVRGELLTVYAGHGALALGRSFFMLFCLDLVRGLCVIYGGSAVLLNRSTLLEQP